MAHALLPGARRGRMRDRLVHESEREREEGRRGSRGEGGEANGKASWLVGDWRLVEPRWHRKHESLYVQWAVALPNETALNPSSYPLFYNPPHVHTRTKKCARAARGVQPSSILPLKQNKKKKNKKNREREG